MGIGKVIILINLSFNNPLSGIVESPPMQGSSENANPIIVQSVLDTIPGMSEGHVLPAAINE